MKRLTAAILTLLALVSCDRNLTGPPMPNQPAVFAPTTALDVLVASRSRLANEESASYDRVMAHFPAESREYLQQQLAVSGRRIQIPNDKVGQGLIDAYYRKRAEAGQASQLSVVPATLALVDKLPAQDAAAAVIVRRVGAGDTILLPEGTAGVESLGSAITALYAIRAREGDVAPRNTRFSVENAIMPKHWKGGLDEKAAKTLAELKHAGKKNISGIGDARTTQILLVGN